MIVGPVVVLGGLELLLRVCGYGRDYRCFIPDGTKPGCYRTNPDFTALFTPPSFQLQPVSYRIPEHKARGTHRVFVVGESAVMGVPAPEFGVVPQLRALLAARHPGEKLEVYNLGITAINSHVLYQAVRDITRFSPDMVLIYMGNNEVVGPYGPGSFYSDSVPPLWVIRASIAAKHTRLGQLLGRILSRRSGEVREWEGMKMFAESRVRAADPRLGKVYQNFEANLEDMVNCASDAGAKVVLATVVANLKDCAPFVSLHREGLSQADLSSFAQAHDAGILAWRLGNHARARELLEQAARIDPEYAETAFVLGRVEEALGEMNSARRHYGQALHFDALRFRPDQPINETVRRIAREAGRDITFVDAAMLLGSDPASTEAISGREILFEHVHFNFSGNYRLASLLAQACERPLFGSTGGGEWATESEVSSLIGYTRLGAMRAQQGMDDQGALPPFTSQITYPDDRRDRAMARRQFLATLAGGTEGRFAADVLDGELQIVDRAIALNPESPQLLRLRMEVDFMRADYTAALQDFERCVALEPLTDGLRVLRAQILVAAGRGAEAVRLLEPVVEREFPGVNALRTLVTALSDQKQYERARNIVDGLLAKAPNSSRLRMLSAELRLKTGDASGAVDDAVVAFDRSSGDPHALEVLCQCYQAVGRNDRSIPDARLRAASVQPRNLANNLYLADYYERAGDNAQSLRFLEAAADSGGADSTVFLRLARRQYELQRPELMLYNLRRAYQAAIDDGKQNTATEIRNLMQRYAPGST
jgi:tetratricopeptide (TPR) repeat protein